MTWEQNIIDDWAEISTLLGQTKAIAVLGIKLEAKLINLRSMFPSTLTLLGLKSSPSRFTTQK